MTEHDNHRPAIREAIIVEGRYDQSKLASILNALIVTTDGFGIYRDREKREYIRRLARERGVVILTDSDAAGFQIRAYLAGLLPAELVKHAYLPDIRGKERRKTAPSAEGKLGAEGMDTGTLQRALQHAGIHLEDEAEAENESQGIPLYVGMGRLYADGIVGCDGSRAKRSVLLERLSLPERMTTKALLQYLNRAVPPSKYEELLSEIAGS